jgi:hypothetical protein
MAKISLAEVLKKCSEFEKKQQRIEALQYNASEPMKIVLQYMFHPAVNFLLPEGVPPYKISEFNEPNMLYSHTRKLYHFIDGGNPDLSQIKREGMFIDLLQSVDPDDAELLIAMKEKKSPFEGLTQDVVLAAFPELFPT